MSLALLAVTLPQGGKSLFEEKKSSGGKHNLAMKRTESCWYHLDPWIQPHLKFT